MMSRPLDIVFAGTPQFAASHLASVLASHHRVVAIYTQPDRPAGRGKRTTASPVKQLGLDHAIPIHQPTTLKSQVASTVLAELRADVMVVVAYGLLLPSSVLAAPRLGCINVHASLLPRWRGAAPIHRAIEAGDTETGVTIMAMDEGLDTGAMVSRASVNITPRHTTQTLTEDLEHVGSQALLRALDSLEALLETASPQPDIGVTYAHKVSKNEGAINWRLSAAEIDRKIRALTPSPGCFSVLRGERVKISNARPEAATSTGTQQPGAIMGVSKAGLTVACGEGVLMVDRVQLPNRKPLPIKDILNGNKDQFRVGEAFVSEHP